MIEVRKTRIFEDWLVSLHDRQARMRIQARIDRLAFGNPGQHRVLTGGVCEMKIDCGPGYRVYFARQGDAWVVLLCGGDKASQRADIKAALALANALEN
jgi:putative addiction module killer protein